MNILLIGYRGTGKSTVGRILGARLGAPVYSLDDEIVRSAGMPVPEIVAERGWDGFRDLEQAICAEFCRREDVVIDCGGGVVEREANRLVLQRSGFVVWLRSTVEDIAGRIARNPMRPSLTGKSITDEVAEVLARRTPLYRALAQLEVDTTSLSANEAAQLIIRQLPRR